MGNVTSLIPTYCIVHNSNHGDKDEVGMVRCNGKRYLQAALFMIVSMVTKNK